MRIHRTLVSPRERELLAVQGISPDILKGASITVETGNWDLLLPPGTTPEDFKAIKGVIATSAADITKVLLMAIAQDFAAFNGARQPWLSFLLSKIEEVEQQVNFQADAMDR